MRSASPSSTRPLNGSWRDWPAPAKKRFLEALKRQKPISQEPKEPLWLPLPDRDSKPSPQRLASESTADVTGYGGAAGGGKTDLALGLPLRTTVAVRYSVARPPNSGPSSTAPGRSSAIGDVSTKCQASGVNFLEDARSNSAG
jgi:hypothetical protein